VDAQCHKLATVVGRQFIKLSVQQVGVTQRVPWVFLRRLIPVSPRGIAIPAGLLLLLLLFNTPKSSEKMEYGCFACD